MAARSVGLPPSVVAGMKLRTILAVQYEGPPVAEVNGYWDFFGKYANRVTADDPVRSAIAILGGVLPFPDKWMTVAHLVNAVTVQGLIGPLIPKDDREGPASRERALAEVLDAHADETFVTDTCVLERSKGEGGRMRIVYRFDTFGSVDERPK